MSSPASAGTIAGVRDGSVWDGDAKSQLAALDSLVARQVPLDEAAQVPDHIRAYVARKLSGVNPLETVPNEALGDTDEAAAERCRRLLIDWAREAGINRVRWIMKVEGSMEADVAAYADHEADGLLRLMALIRHKHRDESDWDPGSSDEFAGGMLLRQAQDMSMGYRTRGIFGASWKEYPRLSAATQGKFEGLIMRMVAISQARRAAQVAAFNRKFDDRPIPTTKAEADQLMADMISEVIGRRVEPPTSEAASDSGLPPASTESRSHRDRVDVPEVVAAEVISAPAPSRQQRTVGIDDTSYPTIADALRDATDGDEVCIGPGDYREALLLDKSVVIRGVGPRERVIVRRLNDDEPCISINAGEPHVSGLTIADSGSSPGTDRAAAPLVSITGGAPVLSNLDIDGGDICVALSGPETAGTIRSCVIHGADSAGIAVAHGATPNIEDNDVWGNAKHTILELIQRARQDIERIRSGRPARSANEIWGNAQGGIWIAGAGTAPLVHANRVHDGKRVGIFVAEGASPRVEGNEVWGNAGPGLQITDAGSDPIVRANRVHDGLSDGIFVEDGASPEIAENEVWGNAQRGIGITDVGTDPVVRANRVHDCLGGGIFVEDGARPRIEENEVWGNANPGGIVVSGEGTDPVIRANRVHDSKSYGIVATEGASPQIEDNEVWGHPRGGIIVQGAPAGDLRTNRLHDNGGHDISFVEGAGQDTSGSWPPVTPPAPIQRKDPERRKVDGSRYLFTAGGRSAYLADGTELRVVVTTEDGRIGVLTDDDRWYVATLDPVPGVAMTKANVLKVHGGKPYAYRDAEKLAASRDRQGGR